MGLKIVHISDTHGKKFHDNMEIPKCDVLIHSGDIGGRTGLEDLAEFLNWFKSQPTRVKIFIAGNNDIILDRDYLDRKIRERTVSLAVANIAFDQAKELIEQSGVIYLQDSSFVFEGVKFYGSPYSPSFHRAHWAFNADRGQEINKIWSKIDEDTNVLITHGPPYGILDIIPDSFKAYADEDVHRGCEDLGTVISQNLLGLKLHCYGHIHEGPTRIENHEINGRNIIFSNAAVLDNRYRQILFKPSIINI